MAGRIGKRKWKTSSGIEVFQVLSGRSNSYLIHSDRRIILVDTGKESALEQLQGNINQLCFSVENIEYLLLTHTHFDHCQNAAKLKSWSNCQIIAGQPETDFAGNGYTPLPKGVFLFSHIISALGNWIGKAGFGYKPFHPDVLIQDETKLDDRVKIVPTPGHSAGSVSLILDGEIAVVGDALFGVFRNSVLPPFADDLQQTIKSWIALLSTGCHTFLPGHGRPITRDLLQRELEKFSGKN